MRNTVKKLIDNIINKCKKEHADILNSKQDIDAKNIQIMLIVTFSCAAIMSFSVISSYFNDIMKIAGFLELRYAYIAVVAIAVAIHIKLRFFTTKHVNVMVYIVNFLAIIYGFLISAFVAPDTVTVTFITAIFMAATLYIVDSWKINTFIVLSTAAFLVFIYQFKPLQSFNAEVMNTTTIMFLAIVIGTIVRSARIEIFTVKRALQSQAHTDQLTKLFNRRMLFEDIKASEQLYGSDKIAAFGMVDIDYFKKYNDMYGHQMGDACLEQVSAVFLDAQKNGGVKFYRYGGEEFVAAFYGDDKQQMENKLKNVMAAISALRIEHKDSAYKQVTVSMGLAFVDEKASTRYEVVLSHADIALYSSKEKGRNMITVYDESLKAMSGSVEDKARAMSRDD